MCVSVVMLVLVDDALRRQTLHPAVLGEFGAIDPHGTVDNSAPEAAKPVTGVVAGHPGVEPVVPAVHPTDQVRPVDMTIREQSPPMPTSTGQHAVLVVPADHHQIDAIDLGCHRRSVDEVLPLDDLHLVDERRCRSDRQSRCFLRSAAVHDELVTAIRRNVSGFRPELSWAVSSSLQRAVSVRWPAETTGSPTRIVPGGCSSARTRDRREWPVRRHRVLRLTRRR